MITLRIRPNRMVRADHRVLEVEVFRVTVPEEALVLVAAARPTLTRPMAVGGDQIQEEVEEDAHQEEGEDQDHQDHQMTQEEAAAAQEVAAATDQWDVEGEVEADLTAAGADLTSISLTLMLLVAAAEEQAQAQVQRTTLF